MSKLATERQIQYIKDLYTEIGKEKSRDVNYNTMTMDEAHRLLEKLIPMAEENTSVADGWNDWTYADVERYD